MPKYIDIDKTLQSLPDDLPYKASVKRALMQAPEADVAEVKRGKWIRQEPNPDMMKEFHKMGIGTSMSINSVYWVCSECGTWGTPTRNYCPNCGAKMDGGTSDGQDNAD